MMHKKNQKKTNSTKAQKQRAESRSKAEGRGRLGIEQRKGGARLYGGTVAKAEERRKGGDGWEHRGWRMYMAQREIIDT